jgi:hypothetical protein
VPKVSATYACSTAKFDRSRNVRKDALEELKQLAKKQEAEVILAAYASHLLALALALRMTKVTGEIRPG